MLHFFIFIIEYKFNKFKLFFKILKYLIFYNKIKLLIDNKLLANKNYKIQIIKSESNFIFIILFDEVLG